MKFIKQQNLELQKLLEELRDIHESETKKQKEQIEELAE